MIRPLILPDPSAELRIIVGPATDIDDEKVILVVLVEVAGDVVDGVPIGLLEEAGGGVGHSYNAACYVGQV